MMTALFFAYILAYSYNGDQFYGYGSTNPGLKGLESRILEAVGPEGLTIEKCREYANARRKAIAIDKGLSSYMQLKFECVPLPLSDK